MTREELLADIDEAAQAFAEQIVAQDEETTGVPKPPKIEVTESQLDPVKFGFDLTHDPSSESAGVDEFGGGGPPIIPPGPPPPPPHVGACCGSSFGGCSMQTPELCSGLGGSYMGDGSFCDPAVCGDETTGACCSGGGCTITSSAGCWTGGGSFLGIGTNCDPGICGLSPCPCGYGPLDASGGTSRWATKVTQTQFNWSAGAAASGATHLDWQSTQTETFDLFSCLSTSNCSGDFNCEMTYTGHEEEECSWTGTISGATCHFSSGACAGCESIPDPFKCEDCQMFMANLDSITWVDGGLSCSATFCSQTWSSPLPIAGGTAQMFQFQYLSGECTYTP
jgi:hypothetical protein